MEFETDHNLPINDAKYDFYGNLIATASSDNLVKVFESKDGKSIKHIQNLVGHQGPVWRIAWAHPKFGKIIASCGYSKRIIVWNESNPEIWAVFLEDDSFSSSVNDVKFLPMEYGLVLAAVSGDGFLNFYIFDEKSRKWSKNSINIHSQSANSITFAQYKQNEPLRFATCGNDDMVKFWYIPVEHQNSSKGKAMAILPDELNEKNVIEEEKSANVKYHEHCDWVNNAAWAPSLFGGIHTVASASDDGSVKIWERNSRGVWSVRSTVRFGVKTCSVSWSSLGSSLVVGKKDCSVGVIEENKEGEWEIVQKKSDE